MSVRSETRSRGLLITLRFTSLLCARKRVVESDERAFPRFIAQQMQHPALAAHLCM